MIRGTQRSRLLMIAASAALLAAAAVSLTDAGHESATSAHAAPDNEFSVVGDGSLPDERPSLGAPRDPLSPQEVGYTITLATQPSQLPTDSTDVHGGPGAEVLGVELPADDKTTDRSAVVQLYDYTSNIGLQQTVNLRTGGVTTRSNPRVQPPISATEADVAVQVAIDHRPALEFVREFEQGQNTPLLSPDQVTPVVGTFVHDGSTVGGTRCGVNRCGQLMLRTPSGAYLSTWQFVVDLSEKRVVIVTEEEP